MTLFKDADEVYETLGKLFTDLAADEAIAEQFKQANTVVRYAYTDPDAVLTVRLQEGQPSEVDFGESQMEPEVTMTMSADVGHRFWLGQVNATVALARGQIRADGPAAKILRLVPLVKPVFPRYKAQLEAQGRDELIVPSDDEET
ncbi:MAG: SCP2 sterol-binding domain-containing protein [Solirubrobacterales bacterium]